MAKFIGLNRQSRIDMKSWMREGLIITVFVFLSLSWNQIVDFLVHYDAYGFLFGIHIQPIGYPLNILASLFLNATLSIFGFLLFIIVYKKTENDEVHVTFLPPVVSVFIPLMVSSLLIHYWAIPSEFYASLITVVGAFFLLGLEHPKNREKMKNAYYARMVSQIFIYFVIFALIAGTLSFPLIEALLIKHHTSMPDEQTLHFNNLFIHRNVDLKSALNNFWFDFKENQIGLRRTGLMYQYAFSFIAYSLYAFYIFRKLYNCTFLAEFYNIRIKRKENDLYIELFNKKRYKIGECEIKDGANRIDEFEAYRQEINENVRMRIENINKLCEIAKESSNKIFSEKIASKLEDRSFIFIELDENARKIPLELCAAYHTEKMKKMFFGRYETKNTKTN